jgi:hypothetical protein
MKRIYFTLALLFTALILTARLASARQSQSAIALTFGKFYLFGTQNYLQHPWPSSSAAVDSSGGAHAAFGTTQGVFYAYCSTNCGNPVNWQETQLAATGDSSFPVLALDSTGHPRLMHYKNSSSQVIYTYAACDANCINAGSWATINIPLDVSLGASYPTANRYFAIDPQGRPRFVAYFHDGLLYATCDSGCTTSTANWHINLLNLGGSGLQFPQLAFNTTGQPRVAGVDFTFATFDYAQCNSSCSSAANWSRVTVADDAESLWGHPTFSLRLDSQGRPRMVFYKDTTSDTSIYYAWSNANFTSPAGWASYPMPMPPADDRTIDLAIGHQDRPRIAFASDQFNLRYLECDVSCESQDAEWTVDDVETGAELNAADPIAAGPGCSNPTWKLDGYPSLALDSNDAPLLSYHAIHQEICGSGSTHENAWGIRFAKLGGSTQYAHQIYLPLVIR